MTVLPRVEVGHATINYLVKLVKRSSSEDYVIILSASALLFLYAIEGGLLKWESSGLTPEVTPTFS